MSKLRSSFLFLMVLGLVASVTAQDLILYPRGLDIQTNELTPDNRSSAECTNWDLGSGTMNKRMGYDILDSVAVTNGDSIYTGISGWQSIQKRDKRLFATVTQPSTAFTKSYVYDIVGYTYTKNTYTIDSFLNEWLYRYSTPSWEQFDEFLILANGYNRPLCWDGYGIKPLMEMPPGAFDFAPLHDTDISVGADPWDGVSRLNGDYYYAWRVAMPCSTGAAARYPKMADSMNLTGTPYRVSVNNDWVVIKDPKIFLPETCAVCIETDSVIAQLCRTRAYRPITDSFFRVMEIRITNDSTPLPYWIDSIPDESLGVTAWPFVGFIDTVARVAINNYDSLYKAGAPVWIQTDSTATTKVAHRGLSKYLENDDTLTGWTGTHYFVMLYDTALSMVTDSGPSIKIEPSYDSTSQDDIWHFDYSNTIGLPSVHGCGHLWRLLCRAKEQTVTRNMPDTAYQDYIFSLGYWNWVRDNYTYFGSDQDLPVMNDLIVGDRYGYFYGGEEYAGGPAYYADGYEVFWQNGRQMVRVRGFISYDTTQVFTDIEPYYIIDTIKDSTQHKYTDSIDFDYAVQNYPPAFVDIGWTLGQCNYPTAHNKRIYVAHKDMVYYSDRGKVGKWPAGNRFMVGDGGNNDITALFSHNGELNIFFNRSWWKARENGAQHTTYEYHSGVGCIAPHSLIGLPDGGFAWLALDGIHVFKSYLSSEVKTSGGHDPGLLSYGIQPYLDNWTYSDLHECNAWMTEDQKNIVFSFPTKDTSFVYALNGMGWGIWTYAPRQTTLYDTSTVTTVEPITDIVFIQNKKNFTYIYGGLSDTTKTDPVFGSRPSTWTRAIPASYYKTAPLFLNPPQYGKIDHVGVWKYSNETELTSLAYAFYNEDGSLLKTIYSGDKGDSVQTRWRYIGVNPAEALYYQFRIYDYTTNIDSLAIQRIDLWYEPTGIATEH